MKYLIIIIIALLMASCSKNKGEYENVILHYNTGALFCSGNHKVTNGEKKQRVGNWKFYYPNGKISHDLEYNDNDEIINAKLYSEDGKIIESDFEKDKIKHTIKYYSNGNIKEESITEKYVEGNEEDESEGYTTLVKEYYESGMLKEQTNYTDDILDGEKKIWDSTGVVLLTINYAKGVILTDNKND